MENDRMPVMGFVYNRKKTATRSKAAGIDKPLTTHWARHTCATLLLNAGVDMETVAKILGHTSTRVTRSVYAKLLDETVGRKMEKLAGLSPGPSPTQGRDVKERCLYGR